MSKKQTQLLNQFISDAQVNSDLMQSLALFALEEAKNGDIQYANQLILTVANFSIFDPNYLIEWFEVFGQLKWSNKKGKLVNSQQGEWLLTKAKSTHWSDISIGKLSKGSFPNSDTDVIVNEPLSKSNFSASIHAYLKAHPIEDFNSGKFGVPADKNLWRKYKLRTKRK